MHVYVSLNLYLHSWKLPQEKKTKVTNPNENSKNESNFTASSLFWWSKTYKLSKKIKAALRQLAAYSDSTALMESDIQKLIKPKLKDSFFMCSSTEESYV